MLETLPVERAANGADAPIHHVGGGDDVAARARLVQRLADENLDGFVVDDLVADHQAVLPVAGVGVERNVGHHPDFGDFGDDGAHGTADEIVLVQGLAAGLVAKARVSVGKQGKRGNAQIARLHGGAHRLVNGQALNARHGADRLALALSLDDEDRPDQIVGRDHVFAHEAAGPLGAAQAPGAMGEVQARCGKAGHDCVSVIVSAV